MSDADPRLTEAVSASLRGQTRQALRIKHASELDMIPDRIGYSQPLLYERFIWNNPIVKRLAFHTKPVVFLQALIRDCQERIMTLSIIHLNKSGRMRPRTTCSGMFQDD